MLLHDLRTRDRLWEAQGGRCAVLHHAIPREASFLWRGSIASEANETCVIGWAAALAIETEVREEICSEEYAEVMRWRKIPHGVLPDCLVAPDGAVPPELAAWGPRWMTWLPMAVWLVLGDQITDTHTLGAAWRMMATLNEGLGTIERQLRLDQPGRYDLVWWPAQWDRMRDTFGEFAHSRRVDGHLFRRADHQVVGWLGGDRVDQAADPTRICLDVDAISLVMRGLARADVTAGLFAHANLIGRPIDPGAYPFAPGAPGEPWILDLAKGHGEDLTVRAERVFGALYGMALAHQVDAEEADAWARTVATGAMCAAEPDPAGHAEMRRILGAKSLPLARLVEIEVWRDLFASRDTARQG